MTCMYGLPLVNGKKIASHQRSTERKRQIRLLARQGNRHQLQFD